MVDNTYPLAKVKYKLNTQHFEEVALKIKEHGKNMKSDDLENVYGLYKQAKEGDLTLSKPELLSGLEAIGKWDAWEAQMGKT